MRRGIQGRLLAECNDPKAQDDKVFKMTPKSCDSCAPSWPLDNHRHSTACQHDAIISFLYSWQTYLQSYRTCTAGRLTCNRIIPVQLADTPAIISYLYSWPTHLQSYRTCTAGRLTCNHIVPVQLADSPDVKYTVKVERASYGLMQVPWHVPANM